MSADSSTQSRPEEPELELELEQEEEEQQSPLSQPAPPDFAAEPNQSYPHRRNLQQ